MRLSTFSAILQFAIDREKVALEYFAKADAAGNLRAETEKNIRALQTILRENVTELVMEPYDSIESDDFSTGETQKDPLLAGVAVLKKQLEFLREAAKVIKMRDVARALQRITDRGDALLQIIKEE